MSRSNVYRCTTAVYCVFLCARVRVHVLCVRGDSADLGERATMKLMLHITGLQERYCNSNRFLFPWYSSLGKVLRDRRRDSCRTL